jgi:uncharacterized alkaline shock family protein YloU
MPAANGSPEGAAQHPSTAHPPIDREQLARLVRRVATAAYGVAEVRGQGWYQRLLGWLDRPTTGVAIATDPKLHVEIDLAVVPGVPGAQVASNVEEAVRYLVQRDMGVAIDELEIRVDGVRVSAGAGGGGGPHTIG